MTLQFRLPCQISMATIVNSLKLEFLRSLIRDIFVGQRLIEVSKEMYPLNVRLGSLENITDLRDACQHAAENLQADVQIMLGCSDMPHCSKAALNSASLHAPGKTECSSS